MPTFTPTLWFDNDMEEAVKFYVALFPNSSIDRKTSTVFSEISSLNRIVVLLLRPSW